MKCFKCNKIAKKTQLFFGAKFCSPCFRVLKKRREKKNLLDWQMEKQYREEQEIIA